MVYKFLQHQSGRTQEFETSSRLLRGVLDLETSWAGAEEVLRGPLTCRL